MPSSHIVASAAAALVFAATFLFGAHVHPLRGLVKDRRALLSFGAGVATAYMFVHVMPELHGARRAFAEAAPTFVRYEGMAVYYCALFGFLVFYGIEHLRKRWRGEGEEPEQASYRIQLGGFAAYVWLTGYLLVNSLEETVTSLGLFAFAMTVHFLGVDNSLRKEHRAAYLRSGRYVLAAMAVLGWGVGMLVELPRGALALLLSFISGAVIMNSSIMELPSEADGRFRPFLAGGLIYGLILLPLG